MSGLSQRAIEAAKSVLAKCNANDPWFPRPAESTIFAWAEHFALTNIELDDLLTGVTAAYHEHGRGFRPLPADIISAARMIRHDRVQRESDAVREARQTGQERKAANDICALAAGAVMGPIRNRTTRLIEAEKALQTCHGRAESIEAIGEFFAAKADAHSRPEIRIATPDVSPLTVKCTWCGAGPLTRCTTPGTQVQLINTPYHPSRIEAAEKMAANR